MSISDEIRELCDIGACHDELCELADRIDREMVELPKDADGVPIHAWDTVYGWKSGSKMEVRSMSFNGQWHLTTNKGHISNTSLVAHEMPDSLGRIADELDEQAGSLTKDGYAWQEDAIHDLADRIRKLAEKEGE